MNLEQLLRQKGLVSKHPPLEEIHQRIQGSDKLTVFYGETYDSHGNTIDSMKYYFFVDSLGDAIRELGKNVDPRICIADTAACRNVSSAQQYTYMKLGESRAYFVEQLNDIYATNLNVVRMSEFIDSEEFQARLEQVRRECAGDDKLMDRIEKTVPPSKVDIERGKQFGYSFDEITTILDLDFKVGPPREELYDGLARDIAKRFGAKYLLSIFLSPAFPFGKGWDYFFAHEGIEEYGITAYKAASKRLQDHRIIVGRTTTKHLKQLIDESFISSDPTLPNPVLDVGIIAETARMRLEGRSGPVTLYDDFYQGRLKEKELKRLVYKSVSEHILSRFE